jgi:general secretion pathway protein L
MRKVETALAAAGAFWRWWRDEMAGLIPERLRRRVSQARGRTIIAFGPDDAIDIVEERDGRILHRERLAPESRPLLAALPQPVVRLDASAGLRSLMTLPLAAERNLAQVVSFELERRTPFKRDEICYAHRIAKRDPAAQRLLIEVTIVQRPVVDRVLALLRGFGVEPTSLEVAGADRTEAVSPNLLGGRTGRRGPGLPDLALAALGALTLLLGATALLLPLIRAHMTEAGLEAEIAALTPAADETRKLENEIAALAQESGFLVARRAARPTATEIIDVLTRLLPDEVYLVELHLAGVQLQIIGTAPSASRTISLIARAPGLADARFEAQVTQDQRSGREQFDIAAHVLPEAVR